MFFLEVFDVKKVKRIEIKTISVLSWSW